MLDLLFAKPWYEIIGLSALFLSVIISYVIIYEKNIYASSFSVLIFLVGLYIINYITNADLITFIIYSPIYLAIGFIWSFYIWYDIIKRVKKETYIERNIKFFRERLQRILEQNDLTKEELEQSIIRGKDFDLYRSIFVTVGELEIEVEMNVLTLEFEVPKVKKYSYYIVAIVIFWVVDISNRLIKFFMKDFIKSLILKLSGVYNKIAKLAIKEK